MYKNVKDVFKYYKISERNGYLICKTLYKEGYTYDDICYVAFMYQEKLEKFIGDRRMTGVMINAVRKYTLKKKKR